MVICPTQHTDLGSYGKNLIHHHHKNNHHSLIPAAMRAAQPQGAPHEVFEIVLDPPYLLDAGLCLGVAIEVGGSETRMGDGGCLVCVFLCPLPRLRPY